MFYLGVIYIAPYFPKLTHMVVRLFYSPPGILVRLSSEFSNVSHTTLREIKFHTSDLKEVTNILSYCPLY